MTIITVSRAATPDEISAEVDRRGAAIEHLETNLRHWREECGKLHAQLDAANEKLASASADAIAWADKIDRRLGPISGADADKLAIFLRRRIA